MTSTSRTRILSSALVAALVATACGSEADPAAEVETEPVAVPVETEAPDVSDDDEDHGGDHSDEEHDDEEHKDDGHDDHKDDEDHDDHSDEDHDEHDDEHSDEEHDEHGDDEDHDHDDSGELGAHEHGTAEMSVAWVGDEVNVELVSPNFNVFGFEYEPTSDEDVATEADRTTAITGPGIVTVNEEANCSLSEPATSEIERDGSHSEITVSWNFDCENPNDVSQLDFAGLFAEFPGFKDIDAQWISDSEQSAAELDASSTTLSLRG